jgi:hypothetical protein
MESGDAERVVGSQLAEVQHQLRCLPSTRPQQTRDDPRMFEHELERPSGTDPHPEGHETGQIGDRRNPDPDG